MIKACPICNKIFDYDSKSVTCPHNEFPKKCKIHNRFHCDNLECRGELIPFRLKEKKNA